MKYLIAIVISLYIATFTTNAQGTKKIQVAVLLDTSNSMDGLIDQTKSQLWKIVNELSGARYQDVEPELEIALFEYGNDKLSVRGGYIRMLSPLSQDLDKISGELFALKTNGGSEYCGQVIQTATERLSWSKDRNDLKMIFIAGNEPFDQGSVDYVEAVATAKSKGIVVNTIFCGPWKEGVNSLWKDGAIRTDGEYMNIDQDKKTVYVPSPYDDQIIQLNKQLNKTYKGYGNKGIERGHYQRTQDSNASSYSKENLVNRAISKSKKAYKNSSWDLVDAAEEDEEFVQKAKKDKLPKEYQKLSKEELTEEIQKLKKQRSSIKTKIAKLEVKRNKFVSDKRKTLSESDNSLDAVMMKSVRKQATKKNYKFK